MAARTQGRSRRPSTVKVNPNTYQLGRRLGGAHASKCESAYWSTQSARDQWRRSQTHKQRTTTQAPREFCVSTLPSNEGQAEASARLNEGNNDGTTTGVVTTTLTVTNLANGGVASSIGSSSNAASNLVIQGATLKYAGGAASTDRLFTVGYFRRYPRRFGNGCGELHQYGCIGDCSASPPQRFDRDGRAGRRKSTRSSASLPIRPPRDKCSRRMIWRSVCGSTRPQGDFTPPTGGSPVRVTDNHKSRSDASRST